MFQTLTVALLLGSPFDDASHNGMLTTLPILFLLCCFFARFVFLDQRSLRHSIDLGISTLAQAWGLERGGRWACTATHLSYRRRPPASLLWGEACLNLGIGWVSFEEPNLSLLRHIYYVSMTMARTVIFICPQKRPKHDQMPRL